MIYIVILRFHLKCPSYKGYYWVVDLTQFNTIYEYIKLLGPEGGIPPQKLFKHGDENSLRNPENKTLLRLTTNTSFSCI